MTLSRLAARSTLLSSHCGNRMILSQSIRSSARTQPNNFTSAGKRQSWREWFMAPSTGGSFSVGRGVVAGASALGLGSLCWYGAGMANGVGIADKSMLWSPEVRQRVSDTYLYFGGGIAATAASAVAVSRSPRLMHMFTRNSLLSLGATIAALIGTSVVTQSLPYTPGLGSKQLAWLAHAALLGGVVAPLSLMGGRVIVQAAWTTAGLCGGLSALAWCAPSEKFLNMGGPLALGLGAMFATSVGSFFVPANTRLFAGMASFWIYGGLVLFSMFLLHDTQKIAAKAENYPLYASRPFDPINASMGIYMDTMNIFIRLAYILGMGGGNKRR